MTDEEAVKELETELNLSFGKKKYEALDLALSALRDRIARQNPKPLTLDELRKMDGEPVWVDVLGDKAWWVVIGSTERGKLTTDYGGWFDFRDYGKTWIAYRTKPELPEREANHAE